MHAFFQLVVFYVFRCFLKMLLGVSDGLVDDGMKRCPPFKETADGCRVHFVCDAKSTFNRKPVQTGAFFFFFVSH